MKIDKSITIDRPAEAVWDCLTNLENMPRWDRDVVEARKITAGPICTFGKRFSEGDFANLKRVLEAEPAGSRI